MIQLRKYQEEAVDSVRRFLQEETGNPCVDLPVASGKSYVIAELVRGVAAEGKRVVVCAHVKELVEQNHDKFLAIAPDLRDITGINSEGLGSRDKDRQIIFAGIQSIFRHTESIGHIDVIIIDEAHLIPPKDDGMYRSFIRKAKSINPNVRVVGLTATAYRMTSGPICGEGQILTEICYSVSPKDLIAQGFLSPPVTKGPRDKIDTSSLHILGGEFKSDEMENLYNQKRYVLSAVSEIVERTKGRKSVLVFAAGVEHGQALTQLIRERGGDVAEVYGDTPTEERDDIIARFRSGLTKYLVNCGVLTTGFDSPQTDAIAIVRATCSPGLFVQMCGRGSRLSEGKTDFLVLDFGNNALRHGPLDAIHVPKPGARGRGDEDHAKTCPTCYAIIALRYATCPDCGHEFPKKQIIRKHEGVSADVSLLSGESREEWSKVKFVRYAVMDATNPKYIGKQMMVATISYGFIDQVKEFVCLEYDSYARYHAQKWWGEHSKHPCPVSAREGLRLAQEGHVRRPSEILVRTVAGEKYPKVVRRRFAEPTVVAPRPEPVVELESVRIRRAEIAQRANEIYNDLWGKKGVASL